MNAIAKGRFLRVSVLKLRKVIKILKGMTVDEALAQLRLMPQKAAKMAYKVISSARANLMDQHPEIHPEEIVIETIYADKAMPFRRILPRARGRRDIIRKPQSHLTVSVSVPEVAAENN